MAPPPKVFGQTMRKGGRSNYQRQFGGGGGSSSVYRTAKNNEKEEERRQKLERSKQIEASFGIGTLDENETRRGWLYNVVPTTVTRSDDASEPERSGLDLYFCDSGSTFKATVLFRPYLYIVPDLNNVDENMLDILLELLQSQLSKLYESIYQIEIVYKHDLDQPNHLSNTVGRPVLKVYFDTVSQLSASRAELQELVQRNVERGPVHTIGMMTTTTNDTTADALRYLMDLREYDVPYGVRVCTDLDIRAGTWYTVSNDTTNHQVNLSDPDRESKAEPTVLAFDIECTKAPLKFPNADHDEIFMISYMVKSQEGAKGYLIVSKSVVSQDIKNFEYTPKPTYPGPFEIFNQSNEKELLLRFFAEFKRHGPHIVVTYNGDFFDWPYVEARAACHSLDLLQETGIELINGTYRGRWTVHLDAFHWVQRDSYLPQGAQGLKAVTKYKLGYDPVEVDPEDMVRFAQERPVHMATYSVSDAVATYYLYEMYVHLFIFSLSTIIPMGPEDVLSKGSGTLCETLLMVQACKKDILCPNKEVAKNAKFHKGHLLEAETYIGGKVECLETGVYRSDLEYEFDLHPDAFQQLIDNIDRDLTFAIQVEGGKDRSDIVNYEQVRSEIVKQLELLRDRPTRVEQPYIYHLDVGAMYPNIILSNRLQPNAIVNDAICAACDFNQAKNQCKRRTDWVWRGDYTPATRAEYERTKDQLSRETHNGVLFSKLEESEQAELIAGRLKTYARKAYKKTKVTEEETRTEVVCMRENDFYVDTVRQFRDRRYEYKKLNKTWKRKVSAAKDAATKKQCEDRVLVYDSLQVAHKCILNSFYGYVMRKGARWRSMEMAGIVTKTGADIITQARILVERIGRPLELDTDGIWCILPKSFPDVYSFEAADGSKLKLEYPCVMLNADVHDKFTNHQYQTVVDAKRGIFETRSECSIFFEVDGPYRCMVIPASTEEGKLLKKRYAVFNFDGSLAELKGFELKRRGELELVKTFQSQVFERFLDGNSLAECYDAVAEVANHWIDVIDTRGESLEDDELVDLISENRSMSRQLDDYGDQKGTSQTTARRLGEFLGAEIIKDKGLNCKFIIAEQPYGAPVTERAIPTAIWMAEPAVMKHFLRKWLKSPGLDGEAMDIRNVLDWDYYLNRLGKTIQKIITIPAALQKVPNPVPRVGHPDWLESKVNQLNDRFQQRSIRSMFAAKPQIENAAMDIEDVGGSGSAPKRPLVHKLSREATKSGKDIGEEETVEERVELSNNNFGEWLKQRKATWRRSRKERRTTSRGLDGRQTDVKKRKAVSVEGFVREAAKSLSEKEWQILEVREMTTYDTLSPGSPTGSGEFIVWAMVGSSSLQKLIVSVPRTVYISTRQAITNTSNEILEFRQVDKHLPYSKTAALVYEVKMPEQLFKSNKWVEYLKPVDTTNGPKEVFETMYESGTPLLTRILTEIGSVSKLNKSVSQSTSKKSYTISELSRVDRPVEGEYLHSKLSYRRVFLYVRIHQKTKTGIVAFFNVDGGSGSYGQESADVTRPGDGEFNVGASCSVWIIKPKTRNSQQGASLKQTELMFAQLLNTIQDVGPDSEYSCVSPASTVQVVSLKFVDSEELAYAGANEAINSQSRSGPTFILLNSSRPPAVLRRCMSTLGSFPVMPMAFPPGPAHDPSLNTLPSLNWEPPALQLSLEAYLYMMVVSFPKRVSYSRYGHVPLGNLNQDENTVIFDVSLSRLIQKNRALSWASLTPGRPDVGVNYSKSGGIFPISKSPNMFSQDEIWGDDDDLISPVIRRPGCYRSICIDIDVQDLAIAALTNNMDQGGVDPSSPHSAMMFDPGFSKLASPLGDEMSTSISLPIIQALVTGWLKDAIVSNSLVADELLHHIYRLLSNPATLLHDPALHRVVHSLMKTTFLRLLSELQRLGCLIVYASFHKVTVATNKLELSGAEEYIQFVMETVKKQIGEGDALAKVSLRPRQFHSNFLFLDEYNFGTMQLERIDNSDHDTNDLIVFSDGEDGLVQASVVTAWSIMNYLGSEIAQEYFRAIIAKFSKDVVIAQMELASREGILPIAGAPDLQEPMVAFTRKMIAKHFASYLTRAVGEIQKEGVDPDYYMPFATTTNNPALEFVKNVIAVLELDKDVEPQVQMLKRSLLSQVGVAEYANVAQWTNPCPTFILPDVFCVNCQESRDVNLCYLPPREHDQELDTQWVCEDCGTLFPIREIELRLIQIVHKKMVRFVLQDVRCSKTHRVATRTLVNMSSSEASAPLKLDIPNARSELELIYNLANVHNLEELQETCSGILSNYQK